MAFSKLTLLALVSVLCASASSAAAPVPHVHPSVHRTLRSQGSVNLIVTMRKGTQEVLASSSLESVETFSSRAAMIEDLVARLTKHALSSQAELKALLSFEEAPSQPLYSNVQSYWISNQVFIQDATMEMVEKLAALSSVAEIREEQILKLPPVVSTSGANATLPTGSAEWGVKMIQATDVWASGNTGKDVVVATIDSGVLGSHEILRANYRGAYGWFDPEAKKATPYDGNGHGTHTMGTIAGANGVGVAPGTTWMACKGCRTDQCPESDLLACAEFITCPTDTQGKNKDCSKAPHVVSNSWGGGQGDSFFQAAVDAWRKAGIIPIFANGNSGPECTTANSPGDYANVIAVGATDSKDALASFSSNGPSKTGLMKPEVSGPGVDVRSSWNSGDSGYNTISGTSMAAPHVAGAVALLLAAKPGLSFDQVKEALTKTADTASLQTTGKTCGLNSKIDDDEEDDQRSSSTSASNDAYAADYAHEPHDYLDTVADNEYTSWLHKSGIPESFHEEAEILDGRDDAALKTLQMFEVHPLINFKRIAFKNISLTKLLARGATGEVWLATLINSGREVAVKRLLPEKRRVLTEMQLFASEIFVLAKMKHPHIISFIGVAWSTLQNMLLIMQHMDKGDLQTYLNAQLPHQKLMQEHEQAMPGFTWWDQKLQVARSIAMALQYLHSLSPKLIHRDVKSKNVLLASNGRALDVKVADFGISRRKYNFEEEETNLTMTGAVGTVSWTAPELLLGDDYTESIDMYSYGILLTEIDTCELPYHDAKSAKLGLVVHPLRLMKLVIHEGVRPVLSPSCPDEIAELIKDCLEKDPAKRPNAATVVERLDMFEATHHC